MAKILNIGVLNCTPDSFSDGISITLGPEPFSPGSAFLERAKRLIDQGFDMLDVGGDSTRPGSICTDNKEEWRRIKPVLAEFSHKVPISVDTHKAEIARRAIDLGATMINDITGGSDEELVETVANSNVDYCYMFSAYPAAHDFTKKTVDISRVNYLKVISDWSKSRALSLVNQGITLKRQIFDPGMGAFVSSDPEVSFGIIANFWEIASPVTRRLLGCSRKGFLAQPGERTITERDLLSAKLARTVSNSAPQDTTLFIRAHTLLSNYSPEIQTR